MHFAASVHFLRLAQNFGSERLIGRKERSLVGNLIKSLMERNFLLTVSTIIAFSEIPGTAANQRHSCALVRFDFVNIFLHFLNVGLSSSNKLLLEVCKILEIPIWRFPSVGLWSECTFSISLSIGGTDSFATAFAFAALLHFALTSRIDTLDVLVLAKSMCESPVLEESRRGSLRIILGGPLTAIIVGVPSSSMGAPCVFVRNAVLHLLLRTHFLHVVEVELGISD